MKKTVLLFIILFISSITHAKNVVQMSMPKAGTHLLKKCICSLTNIHSVIHATNANPIDFYIAIPEKFKHISQNEKHWVTHLFFNKKFEPYLNNDQNAFFFIYRDPRDQIISFAYFMLPRSNNWPRASKISLDELIMELITNGKIYNNHPPCKNINDLYQQYTPWLYNLNVCPLKFEDLVGPKGGGNLETQLHSVKKIADHLGIFLTEKQIQQKANTLFGGTHTFRKGQIGTWKKHFKEHHKAAFKEVAGQLLIDLGYEESFDW
ncbi:sulfotransferase domain-containing protein [Candidatus Dependentiae bacterium]